MASTVIEALRRFLPIFLKEGPCLNAAQRRALWAITHCRTPTMGGHLHVCERCGTREFRFHSCNHRSCPQCGKSATQKWVARQLDQRVGAPYFMVTFTLPAELRPLFFTSFAKEIYQIFFESAARALKVSLAHKRSLKATTPGFTLILHTWNQRLLFHPHIHAIVPGAGLDKNNNVITARRASFLAPKAVLRAAFRQRFKQGLAEQCDLPSIDPQVWQRDWGVNIKPFGTGESIIKYLGAYVCRTAIGNSRIRSITDTHVTFTWKDRRQGGVRKTETVEGVEFVRRYLRHVLPQGLKAVRHFGFCHPAAKAKRERIAFHTGVALLPQEQINEQEELPRSKGLPTCPCCGQPMRRVLASPAGLAQFKRATLARDSFGCRMILPMINNTAMIGLDEQTHHGNGGPYSLFPPLVGAATITVQKPSMRHLNTTNKDPFSWSTSEDSPFGIVRRELQITSSIQKNA